MTQHADQQRAITPGEPPDAPARERRTTRSTLTSLGKGRKKWLLPFCLSVTFTVAIQTLGLSEFLPVPLALLAAAAWGIAIGLIAIRIRNKLTLSAWLEDALVVVGAVAMAFFAFGGSVGTLLLSSALKSSSLSGETLVFVHGGEAAEVDYLCIAAGRGPDVEGLGIGEAGIELDEHGLVKVERDHAHLARRRLRDRGHRARAGAGAQGLRRGHHRGRARRRAGPRAARVHRHPARHVLHAQRRELRPHRGAGARAGL